MGTTANTPPHSCYLSSPPSHRTPAPATPPSRAATSAADTAAPGRATALPAGLQRGGPPTAGSAHPGVTARGEVGGQQARPTMADGPRWACGVARVRQRPSTRCPWVSSRARRRRRLVRAYGEREVFTLSFRHFLSSPHSLLSLFLSLSLSLYAMVRAVSCHALLSYEDAPGEGGAWDVGRAREEGPRQTALPIRGPNDSPPLDGMHPCRALGRPPAPPLRAPPLWGGV
jgi:hypothetical protein